MPVREGQAGSRRRRRTPEAAQREIVEAAEGLLRERPFRELTVDEVMRRTGLSRPSFYVYFKDRHELVLRVVGHLQAELLAVANRWFESSGDGPAMLREAFDGLVAVYGQHSAVMRALADAATDDPDVEAAYGSLVDRFIEVTAEHIEQEMAVGDVEGVDPVESAKALVWMAERYLYHSFAPARRVPPGRMVDVLATLWSRALYRTE